MSDLDRLIRFSAVAETLSFSAAARKLHVDQPWLSRQIQQLEAQLGFPLFVRSTRKVALTPEGEELAAKARELALIAEECRGVSRDLTRSHDKTLALGVHPLTYWVPARKRIIEDAQSRDARINIDISSYYTARLLTKLRNRSLDVIFIAQPFDAPDLEYLVIHESPLSLIVPPEDELAQYKSVPMSALKGRKIPLLSPKLNPALWRELYAPFVDVGVEPLIVKEGDVAISFYARDSRLPVISNCWPHSEQDNLKDFVHVEIEGPVPCIRFALARRAEEPRGLLLHFWNRAKHIIADGEPLAEPLSVPVKQPSLVAG